MIDVYVHTSPSGKRYVGVAAYGICRRWDAHVREALRGSACAFHRAIRKYGPNSFTHEVLERMATEAGAKRAEQLWIAKLGTFGEYGYNLTRGGEGALGAIISVETRSKRAASVKAAHARGDFAAAGAKISAAKKGVRRTTEQRARMSIASKGRTPWNLGRAHSDAQRSKLVAAWVVRRARIAPATCHPERAAKSRGLCDPCYKRAWRKDLP